MKYVLWGFVGLVVLVVAAVVGGGYWFANVKVDFSDPQMAGKFKESFNANCVANFQKRLSQSGAAASEDLLAKADDACSCARDGVVTALAKRQPMTVAELATAMSQDPEIAGITKACSMKIGIANP